MPNGKKTVISKILLSDYNYIECSIPGVFSFIAIKECYFQ